MTLSEELTWRGFVNQMTFSSIKDLDKQKRVLYFGVDPSASSMQIGNLASAMMVSCFVRHGYKAILLVGGATGLIGDPDGKAQERDLLTVEQVDKNKQAIAKQYHQVLGGQDFEVVDNFDWFKKIGYLEFLRTIGKHVPMRQMLSRDFVQSRLGEDGAGISYAEFSYSLIQGYDFLHLYKTKDTTLQICGADQWGNSIAGVDMIRRVTGGEAHVYSMPLILNKATGKKFGKTEDGAVWLNESMTSVYKFYQFWLNVADEGVEGYLKVYSTLDKSELDKLMDGFKQSPGERLAQKRLAYEVTKIVHGEKRAKNIELVSQTLFGNGSYANLTSVDFEMLQVELPFLNSQKKEINLVDVLVELGLASSKTEARRFLDNNAVYINGQQIPLSKTSLDEQDKLKGYSVVRVGKNKNALVKLA